MKNKTIALIHKQAALWLGALLLIQILTGILISFRHEITDLVLNLESQHGAECKSLPFGQVYEKFIAEHHYVDLYDVVLPASTNSAYQFAYDNGVEGLPVIAFVDPCSGETVSAGGLLHYPLEVAIYLHSNLLLGGIGKNLVAVTGLFFIFMTLTGLYLWWPKRKAAIGRSLTIDWDSPPLKKYFQIHRTIGAYFLILFMVLAVTGTLIAAKKFYLVTQKFSVDSAEESSIDLKLNLPIIFANAKKEYPEGDIRVLKFMGLDDALMRVDVIDRAERFAGKKNQLMFNARSGEMLKNLSADNPPLGQVVYQWLIPVHSGKFIGIPGRLINLITGISLFIVMSYGYLLWLHRRRFQTRKLP